jgi:biopolymer transport protein TolQ
MTTDTSILHLLLGASLTVQLVMVLLLAASFASWAIIVRKWQQLRAAARAADAFEDRFWSGGDLTTLYKDLSADPSALQGMERVFESGFREFARLRKQGGVDGAQLIDAARRAMHVAKVREVEQLEHNLGFLATVGSTSPYVGLFGTVWGIMNSFRALGAMQAATLALVAPGIAEALVATAMGLFAAIPAVIAYNRYADAVGRLETRFDNFVEEFSAILGRNALGRAG